RTGGRLCSDERQGVHKVGRTLVATPCTPRLLLWCAQVIEVHEKLNDGVELIRCRESTSVPVVEVAARDSRRGVRTVRSVRTSLDDTGPHLAGLVDARIGPHEREGGFGVWQEVLLADADSAIDCRAVDAAVPVLAPVRAGGFCHAIGNVEDWSKTGTGPCQLL